MKANTNLCLCSVTRSCMEDLIHFRNGTSEMDCLETFGRRVTAEVGFALLVVAGLVETAVRSLFLLPAVAICSLQSPCLEPWVLIRIKVMAIHGPYVSLATSIVAVHALVHNCFQEELAFREISPCTTFCVRDIGECVEGYLHIDRRN